MYEYISFEGKLLIHIKTFKDVYTNIRQHFEIILQTQPRLFHFLSKKLIPTVLRNQFMFTLIKNPICICMNIFLSRENF